jgi:phosphonate transport system substrate-binding protein
MEGKVLAFSGIPNQDVAVWARTYAVMEDYLSEELGVEVRGVPAVDYAAVVTAFRRGDLHLAWFGGLTGVQARLAVPGAEAVAQRPQDEQFHSAIIVQCGIQADDWHDLKGMTFSFGSESSTSGHLMPRYFIIEAGMDPNTDFNGLPNFSGSHDTTWTLVQNGAFQAGVLDEAVWDRAVREGQADTTKVCEAFRTPAYYDYHWTVRPDLDEEFGAGFADKLTQALLNTDDPEVLRLFTTDRFIPTDNDNYARIEEVARSVGIIQ